MDNYKLGGAGYKHSQCYKAKIWISTLIGHDNIWLLEHFAVCARSPDPSFLLPWLIGVTLETTQYHESYHSLLQLGCIRMAAGDWWLKGSDLVHEVTSPAQHCPLPHTQCCIKLTGHNFPSSSCNRAWFLETLLSVIYKILVGQGLQSRVHVY